MKQQKLPLPVPDGHTVIFRAYITLKNGKKLFAKQCGLRAFPIVVPISK